MRAIAGLFFTILFIGALIAIGGGIYEAGVAQGIVDAGRVPAGGAVGVVGHGWGWGFHPFGLFGLLFMIFFLFLLFGLISAAFGRGRGWRHRHGDGYGYGWGYGPKRGPGDGPGEWREERERRMADLHRRLHEEEAASDGTSASSGTSGSSGGTGSSTRSGSNPS